MHPYDKALGQRTLLYPHSLDHRNPTRQQAQFSEIILAAMVASKVTKLAAVNHTAGIFSDMSVDGPEIGTLVCIVDRAKNLPNRRSMGKQDPYCACRLGKEAKKTKTDKRGGQVPRW